VSARLGVVGGDRAIGLAGHAPAAGTDLVVELAEPGAGDSAGTAPAVRWIGGPAEGDGRPPALGPPPGDALPPGDAPPTGDAPPPGGAAPPRLVATAGDGLWSRAPWPARDELFDLPAPPAPRVLVAGRDAERRAAVLDKLGSRGLPCAGAELLDAAGLASASAVALLDAAGGALPAEAPAVLAARRVLIAPRCEVGFGLLAGTDHLAFTTEDDVVQYADAVLSFPRSFEQVAVLGALAAERHRASVVYGRLAAELAGG
jgi:hypothetical protein